MRKVSGVFYLETGMDLTDADISDQSPELSREELSRGESARLEDSIYDELLKEGLKDGSELRELKDPVKMLVDMARRGEIDPWNIDVVEVADRFLEELERAKKLDLRISGRVLLYAAILVRMKAEILAEEAILPEQEEQHSHENELNLDFPEPEFMDLDFPEEYPSHPACDVSEGGGERYGDSEHDSLSGVIEIEDEVIAYLMKPHRKVRRFTTLKDLLKELKKAENVKKKKKKPVEDVKKRILETPHEEDMEETISRVEKELERLFEKKGFVLFSELVSGREIKETLSYYVSLLYLSFRKKIEIEQERIYEDDILVKKYTVKNILDKKGK